LKKTQLKRNRENEKKEEGEIINIKDIIELKGKQAL